MWLDEIMRVLHKCAMKSKVGMLTFREELIRRQFRLATEKATILIVACVIFEQS